MSGQAEAWRLGSGSGGGASIRPDVWEAERVHGLG